MNRKTDTEGLKARVDRAGMEPAAHGVRRTDLGPHFVGVDPKALQHSEMSTEHHAVPRQSIVKRTSVDAGRRQVARKVHCGKFHGGSRAMPEFGTYMQGPTSLKIVRRRTKDPY